MSVNLVGKGYDVIRTRVLNDVVDKRMLNVYRMIPIPGSPTIKSRFIGKNTCANDTVQDFKFFNQNINLKLYNGLNYVTALQHHDSINQNFKASKPNTTYIQRIEIATKKTEVIHDWVNIQLTGSFEKDFENLPPNFNNEDSTTQAFEDFFDRWGSHLISEERHGGYCDIVWHLKPSSVFQEVNIDTLSNKIKTDFLSGSILNEKHDSNCTSKMEENENGSEALYVVDEITFSGGNPSFHNVQSLKDWIDSLYKTQIPLDSPIQKKVVPLYKIVDWSYNEKLDETNITLCDKWIRLLFDMFCSFMCINLIKWVSVIHATCIVFVGLIGSILGKVGGLIGCWLGGKIGIYLDNKANQFIKRRLGTGTKEDKVNALNEATLFHLNGMRWQEIRFSNGFYEGEIVNGKLNGYGIYKYTNGDTYEGQFKNGVKEGYGKVQNESGCVYEGQWKQNVRCGHGLCYDTDGGIYEGAWVDDKHHGIGVYYYNSGNRYVGGWKDGLKHGIGVYHWVSGKWEKNEWDNGIEGRLLQSSSVDNIFEVY